MYEEHIKKSGLSVTKNRIELLRGLDAVKKPITIDDLRNHLMIPMNTSTIYRSLKALVDHGLVYQTDFREGVSYFEFHGKNHHHHIICTVCKKREKIDLCLEKKFPTIQKEKDFIITTHIFELFGVCKNCLS